MHEKTKLIHVGRDPQANQGIVNPPVCHASTILCDDYDIFAQKQGQANPRMTYGRSCTPTMLSCEKAMASLEGGDDSRLTPSGLSAITLILMAMAEQGKHILATDNCYYPTRGLGNGLFKRLGIEFRYFDPTIGSGIEALLSKDTGLVFMETPGSLSFEMTDIEAVVTACKARNIPTAIDNTWGAGLYLKPLEMGVDLSMQAATKYVSGASDMLMGFVAFKHGEIGERIHDTWQQMGAVPGPDVMFSAMRGLRSMAVRLNYHHHVGIEMAQWLEQQPQVEAVLHPALPSHPQHDLWKRDFTGAASLFSFVLKTEDQKAVKAMVEGMEYFKMGYSWGGYESLITPFSLKGIRSETRWPYQGTGIRVHIGQESLEDLKQDLYDALQRWQNALS